MSASSTFTDVMFDREPLGLAEEMTKLTAPAIVTIQTDEEAEAGEEIYFGLAAPTEEIIEVKATVKSCAAAKNGFAILVEVTAVDSAQAGLAQQVLRGGNEPESQGKQPIWGLGLKQMDGSYAVLINCPAGVFTAPQLARIAELSAKSSGIAKLTHAQRVILLVKSDQLESTKAGLEEVGLKVGVLHKGVRNVRACCGALCRFAQNTNALALAGEIDKALFGRGTEFDIKIAISDCLRNCEEAYCADIGLVGNKGMYSIVVGGRGSQIPFRAVQLVDSMMASQLPAAINEIIDWYESHAEPNERFWKVLQRLGESEAKGVDFTAIADAFKAAGDKVDEASRVRDLLARVAGSRRMRQELSFCQ